MRLLCLCFSVAMLSAAPGGAAEIGGDAASCQAAIAGAARKLAVPHGALGAIALVESGRPVGNRVVPWPWSINVGGESRVYESKEAAVAAVRALREAGTASIDVGCMQINLLAHPRAFATLEQAFDPEANADYAARFLQSLTRQAGLARAMTAYHSQTPAFAADYARRLIAVWPAAADLGVAAPPDLPVPPPPPSGSARLSKLTVVSIHGAAWPTKP